MVLVYQRAGISVTAADIDLTDIEPLFLDIAATMETVVNAGGQFTTEDLKVMVSETFSDMNSEGEFDSSFGENGVSGFEVQAESNGNSGDMSGMR